MKPLELTVYPRHPQFGHYAVPLRVWSRIPDDDPDDFYEVTVSPDDLQQRIESKRFTDAELAAEYWRLRLKVCASGNRDMKNVGHVCVEWQAAHDELDTMQRFMDLPHYDEGDHG